VEAVCDGLGEEKNLIESGAAGAEAGLERREEIVFFEIESETDQDDPLEEFGNTGGKRDGAVRRRRVRGLVGFEDGDDGAVFPAGGEGVSGPGEVKEVKQEREGTVR
jgi:hypothetical protein